MAVEQQIILTANANNAVQAIEQLQNSLKQLSNLSNDVNRLTQSLSRLNEQLTNIDSTGVDSINTSLNRLTESLQGISSGNTLNALRENISSLGQDVNVFQELSNEFQQLNTNISQTEQTVTRYNNRVRNVVQSEENQIKTVRDLRREINQGRDSLVSLQEGTEEYRQAVIRTTDAQNQLNTINNITRNGSGQLEQVFRNVTNVSSSLVGAFTAAQGAAALFGANAEELGNVLLRVQASIALLNGLRGFASFPRTLEALRASFVAARVSVLAFSASLSAIPYVAILAGLVALTSGIVALTNNILTNNRRQNDLNNALEEYNILISDANRSGNLRIRILQAEGAAEEEILNERRLNIQAEIELTEAAIRRFNQYRRLNSEQKRQLQDLNNTIESYRNTLNNLYDDEQVLQARRRREEQQAIQRQLDNELQTQQRAAQERRQIRENELNDVRRIVQESENSILSSYEVRINEATRQYNEQRALLERYGEDITLLTYNYQRQVTLIQEEQNTERNNALRNELQEQYNIISNSNNQLLVEAENYIRSLELIQAQYRQRIESGNEDQQTVDDLTQRINEIDLIIAERRTQIDLENIAFLEEYQGYLSQLLESELLNSEQRIQIELELQQTLNEIERAGIDQRINQINREIAARERQRNQEKVIAEARRQITDNILQSFSQAATAVTQIIGQETTAGKAIAVAGALIDTYRGATRALTLPFPANIAASAATIATGLASVQKIVSTNTTTGETNIGSTTVSTIDVTPDIQSYYQPEITPLTQQLMSTENQLLNTRVYVVESDIENSINNSRVRVNESTF